MRVEPGKKRVVCKGDLGREILKKHPQCTIERAPWSARMNRRCQVLCQPKDRFNFSGMVMIISAHRCNRMFAPLPSPCAEGRKENPFRPDHVRLHPLRQRFDGLGQPPGGGRVFCMDTLHPINQGQKYGKVRTMHLVIPGQHVVYDGMCRARFIRLRWDG